MTTTAPAALDLQRAAREHLWLHFTRMGGYRDAEVPIIVRGGMLPCQPLQRPHQRCPRHRSSSWWPPVLG